MAIGKPLLVNQRRDVERAVVSSQTQQLSSNVPSQKINFMSYDIGQANAKASRAVPDELLNMVNKGLEAKLYMDNTKREFKRLSLMEDWQKSNMDFQGRFAQARTPDAQATVIADYENDTQNRIGEYTESQGRGVKQQAQLADLRNTANTQFSKFSVTHQNNIFKQTSGMLATDTATIAQSVAEDVNVDPVVAFKKIADNFGEMVGIGALDKATAQYQQGLLQDKMITGRSGLFARNYAKDILAEGRDLPSDKDFKTQINGVMGLELDERRLKLASRAFTDTYYKELKASNSRIAAEDAHNKEAISADLAVFKTKLDTEILDKTLTAENKQALHEEAKQYDSVIDGFSESVLLKLDAVQYGTASQPQVDHFTLGQGGLDLQAVLESGGVDYYDLEAVEYAMRNAPGEYAGMNENTILGVVRHYRNENAKLVTEFSKRTPLLLKTNMVAAMQNTKIFLQSDEAGMGAKFWNAIKDTTALNWESVFANDLEYGKAFARVQSVLGQAASSGTGPFDKDEIGDNIPARTEALNSFIQQTIVTEFGAATGQKRDKVKAAKAKLVEGDKDQARSNFRLGGTTAKGKPYAGALQDSAKNLTDTLSKQGVEKYQGITERIATDLKRMKAEAQPEWVKTSDKILAAGGSKIVEKIPTMKDVASMVMGNVPTSYITGVKNKKLLNELQDMVGRPLTPDELAGKDEDINEMSRTIIKRDSQIPVVGFITSIFSGSAAETEKKLENLAYEFKHQSLEGIQKGLELAQPKPEPTLQEPTPQETTSEGTPVVATPTTATDDLAEGAKENPFVQTIVGSINDLLGGSATTAEAAYDESAATQGVSQINSYSDYLETVESGAIGRTNEFTADPSNVVDQVNYGHGIKATPEVRATVSRMQAEGKSVKEINDFTLGVAIKEHSRLAKSVYNKNLGGGIPYESQPQKVQELLTELNFNTSGGLAGWPTLVGAAKAGDYETVAKEMYLDTDKGGAGAVRRNKYRKEYFGDISSIKRSAEKEIAPPKIKKMETLAPSLASKVLPTAPKLYAKAMAGDRGIWKEDTFSGEEQAQLKDIVAEKIKKGNFLISYSDYDEEAGSKIGYGMEAPDSSQGLKFSLGQARIVRHGNKIMVADEWDIDSPEKINEMPVMDRMATLFEKVKSGDTSMYGFAHLIGEAFGPQAGEGASIRATIGTAKSLNLSKAQLAKIPQLKQYEAENKHRINPENLGKFA